MNNTQQNTKSQLEMGFTILEAMVAMLVISVGMLALGQLLITSMKQNKQSEVRFDAIVMSHAVGERATAQIASDANCVAVAGDPALNTTQKYQGASYTFIVKCFVLSPAEKYLVVSKVQDSQGKPIAENRILYSTLAPEVP